MKNLKILQIMILIGLAVESISLHAATDQKFENKINVPHDFNTIRNMINEENEKIEQLKNQDVIDEVVLAKITDQLAQAQTAFDQAVQRHRAKHKKNHKLEDAISDNLKKAEQGLKNLYDTLTENKMIDQALDDANIDDEEVKLE